MGKPQSNRAEYLKRRGGIVSCLWSPSFRWIRFPCNMAIFEEHLSNVYIFIPHRVEIELGDG